MSLVNSAISSVTAVAAVTVTFFAYRLQVRSKDQEWYENFSALYSEFWSDSDLVTVRTWIACSEAYSKIEPIIQKKLIDNEVRESEYQVLEKIDKFCSITIRILHITPATRNPKYREMVRRLYLSYWIEKLREREYLHQYIERFWTTLSEAQTNMHS
jgi:hypothetical protein